MELMGYQIWSGPLPEEIFRFRVCATLNPHSYQIAKTDSLFRSALAESDILLPDGIGIVWAAAVINRKRIRKIAGSDLHMHILDKLNDHQGSCFYLGSSETTLKLIEERIKQEFPFIRAEFHSPPYRDSFSEHENQAMIQAVNAFNPDVLFVGMTAPKQEKWVYQHQGVINARSICSIGAVFDFYAGTVERPGPFWIKAGLEFLPRFIKEPRRLWERNIISTPRFLLDILKSWLKSLKRIKSIKRLSR